MRECLTRLNLSLSLAFSRRVAVVMSKDAATCVPRRPSFAARIATWNLASESEGAQWVTAARSQPTAGERPPPPHASRRRLIEALLLSLDADCLCLQESLLLSATLVSESTGETYHRSKKATQTHCGQTVIYYRGDLMAEGFVTSGSADQVYDFPIVAFRPQQQQQPFAEDDISAHATSPAKACPPPVASSSPRCPTVVVCSVHLAPFAKNEAKRQQQLQGVATSIDACLREWVRSDAVSGDCLVIVAGDSNQDDHERPDAMLRWRDAWQHYYGGDTSMESRGTFGGPNDFNASASLPVASSGATSSTAKAAGSGKKPALAAICGGEFFPRYDRIWWIPSLCHSTTTDAVVECVDFRRFGDERASSHPPPPSSALGRCVADGISRHAAEGEDATKKGRFLSDHFGVMADFAFSIAASSQSPP